MKKEIGRTFLDDLFGFLDDMLDSGAEIHIIDKTNPDRVVEHVYVPDSSDDYESDKSIPFDDDDKSIPFDDDLKECDQVDCGECEYNCPYSFDEDDFDYNEWGIPGIDRIIFNDPATIVFWEDGTKTVVKCMSGEKFERYAGFAAACMKKMFGSTSRAKDIMKCFAVDQAYIVEPKKGIHVADLNEALNNVIANHEAIKEAVDEALRP